VDTLSKATKDEYDAIMALRNNPISERIEKYRNREIHLWYHLVLEDSDIYKMHV
jgi:hypothetical protein